jgi:hypothetical protein
MGDAERDDFTCPLCERDGAPRTRHHAKLKRRSPDVTFDICRECHQVVHGLFPGTALARRPDLWTVDGLKRDPAIVKAVAFVKKIPPGCGTRMRERRR